VTGPTVSGVTIFDHSRGRSGTQGGAATASAGGATSGGLPSWALWAGLGLAAVTVLLTIYHVAKRGH
jgi:hypothetical protein